MTATVRNDQLFPAPPSVTGSWRRQKQRALCETAATLRLLGRSRPLSSVPSVGILTYHHVLKQVTSDPYLLNVTPTRFRQQIEGLLNSGYRACSLREVVTCHNEQRAIPEKSFLIVFDDGLYSVYKNAWPVLTDLGVPATMFLATAYLDRDTPLPFDACRTRWSHSGDTRRPLATSECEEMLDSGLVDLGCHTHTHEDFRGRPLQFADDLARSQQLLRKRFGLEHVTFAFPYGRFDAEMQRILHQHQLLCALTAECQLVTFENSSDRIDRFGWGRFGALQIDTPRTLAAKLDGWYTWLLQHWRNLGK